MNLIRSSIAATAIVIDAMKERMQCTGVALLACIALLAMHDAGAQPHKQLEISREAALPVTDTAAIGEWLTRLAGRFKYDGMVQVGDCAAIPSAEGGPPPPPPDTCQGVKGKSDCIVIGEGPGVQCVLNVTWQDIYATDFESGTVNELLASYLDPAMELYGVDPGRSAINHMVVNNKGLPEGGLGFIRGNTATFRTPCVNAPAACYRVVRIEAKANANLLYVWFSRGQEPSDSEATYAVLALRRVPQDEAEAKSGAARQ